MIFEKEMDSWLSIAKEAALKAGAYLLDSDQSSKDISLSIGRDIKIAADVQSERIILDYLKGRTDFPILSEENGFVEGNDKRFVWIVDPLDGSLNYLRGIPLCCVSIGLWQGMDAILGVVYDFFRSELYSGIAGKGAWLNGVEIRNSAIDSKENAVLCTGFPINTDFSTKSLMSFIQKVHEYKKIRLLGSAALSLVYVASGKADAYMENDIMIWDVAGGLAIASGSDCKCSITNGIKPDSLRLSVTNGNFDIGE